MAGIPNLSTEHVHFVPVDFACQKVDEELQKVSDYDPKAGDPTSFDLGRGGTKTARFLLGMVELKGWWLSFTTIATRTAPSLGHFHIATDHFYRYNYNTYRYITDISLI